MPKECALCGEINNCGEYHAVGWYVLVTTSPPKPYGGPVRPRRHLAYRGGDEATAREIFRVAVRDPQPTSVRLIEVPLTAADAVERDIADLRYRDDMADSP